LNHYSYAPQVNPSNGQLHPLSQQGNIIPAQINSQVNYLPSQDNSSWTNINLPAQEINPSGNLVTLMLQHYNSVGNNTSSFEQKPIKANFSS